jgi:hypothetical protein
MNKQKIPSSNAIQFQLVLQQPVLLSHQRKRKKKKESGDSFVNVYLRLWLTCLLLSAICCCRLCLFRVFLDACPFCFLQYTALPAFCNCHLFLYLQFVWGEALLPLQWSFPHDSHCCKLPLSKVAGRVLLLLPSLASLFIYSLLEGLPLPHSPEFWASCPLCYMFFFFFSAACLLFSLVFFSFFPLCGGQSVQGAMLICPRVACGSTVCCLAHLVVCFSQAG